MPSMLIHFQRNTDMFIIAQVENISKNDNLLSLDAPHLYQTTQILHQSFYEKSESFAVFAEVFPKPLVD